MTSYELCDLIVDITNAVIQFLICTIALFSFLDQRKKK